MEWIYLARHRVTGCCVHDNEYSVAINARNFLLSEEILASQGVMELHKGFRNSVTFVNLLFHLCLQLSHLFWSTRKIAKSEY